MGISSSYLRDINSTYHSISTDNKGDHRWASFEYYPYKIGNNRIVYKGISFKSRVVSTDKNRNETDEREVRFGAIDKTYWTKVNCVVKSARETDIDWDATRNESSHWFKKLSTTGSDYGNMFRTEVQSIGTHFRINFTQLYLTEIDNMSFPWNYVCDLCRNHKKRLWTGDLVLIEERINGHYTNFVFSDGMVCEECPPLLTSFVHFTFHKSEGAFVICDLQGAISRDNIICVTAPTIHSKERSFGPKDKGDDGIREVFSNHVCNELCGKDWIKP